MKNVQKIILIITFIMIIIFSMASCDLFSTGGLLTVNGLNVDVRSIIVYTNGTPTNQRNFANLILVSNVRAVSSNSASPFYLTDINERAFKQSGTFLVVLSTFGLGNFTVTYYLPGVVFHNGSATIDFSNMLRTTNIPF
jgi:hypothetical protein